MRKGTPVRSFRIADDASYFERQTYFTFPMLSLPVFCRGFSYFKSPLLRHSSFSRHSWYFSFAAAFATQKAENARHTVPHAPASSYHNASLRRLSSSFRLRTARLAAKYKRKRQRFSPLYFASASRRFEYRPRSLHELILALLISFRVS